MVVIVAIPGSLLGSRDTRARLCEPHCTVRLEMWFNDGVKCNILGLGVAGRLLICLNVCCHHEELPRAAHCHHHNLQQLSLILKHRSMKEQKINF